MDLPGFYYDPEKKKYFAITPGTSGSVFLTQSDARLRSAQWKQRQATQRFVHLSHRIGMQEISLKSQSGLTIREDFARARLQSLTEKFTTRMEVCDYQGNEAETSRCNYMFVEEGTDALYGVWTEDGAGTSILAHLSLSMLIRQASSRDFTGSRPIVPQVLNCFPPASRITDVHSFSNHDMNFVICLSVHSGQQNEMLTSLSIMTSSRERGRWQPPPRSSHDMETRMNFEFPGVFQSCAAAANRFAIGGDKHVKIFTSSSGRQNTIFQGFMNYASQNASSRVTAVRFAAAHGRNDVVLAATNKGHVHTFDLRSPSQCSKTRAARCTINHLRQYDEHKWLLSGHENMLLMLDERCMRAPYHDFEGHVNSCHKLAVCLNESLRTVSMTGEDGITRFWSVDSGKHVAAVPLPASVRLEAQSSSHSWLIQNPLKAFQTCLLTVCGPNLFISSCEPFAIS